MKRQQDRKNLSRRGQVWYVNVMRDGKRVIQSTGETDLTAARAARDRILAVANLTDDKTRTELLAARMGGIEASIKRIEDGQPATLIRQGWAAYLDRCGLRGDETSTLGQYEYQFDAFAKWAAANLPEGAELRQVSQGAADRYAAELFRKMSASTANRHLNLLALVWRKLARSEAARLTDNPWAPERIDRRKASRRTRRPLTIEEVARVEKIANGEMRTLIAVGLFTGLRLGDACCLAWADVDLTRGVISVMPAKTKRTSGRRVAIPIHPALHSILTEIGGARQGYVMPGLAARYQHRRDAVATDVQRLFAKAGIVPRNLADKGRLVPDTGYHSLRHLFASTLANSGQVGVNAVQALVGHGSPVMTERYLHQTVEATRTAILALPGAAGTINAPTPSDAASGQVDAFLTGLAKRAESLADDELVEAKKVIASEIKRRARH